MSQIRAGALRSGERLPPTRILADQLGLNRGTVSSAYDELVADGVLNAHGPRDVRRGCRWTAVLAKARFAGRIISLISSSFPGNASSGGGHSDRGTRHGFAGLVPDETLYPVRALGKALTEVLEEYGAPLLAYGSGGHDTFLDFLARLPCRRAWGCSGRTRTLVVNGSQQAVDLPRARVLARSG